MGRRGRSAGRAMRRMRGGFDNSGVWSVNWGGRWWYTRIFGSQVYAQREEVDYLNSAMNGRRLRAGFGVIFPI